MTRPRDSQRSKVYDFDNAMRKIDSKKDLTLDECRQLIAKALAIHSEKIGAAAGAFRMPELTDGRGSRCGCAFPGLWKIRLPIYARRPYYVIHELAHLLQPRTSAWHGPEFVRVYLAMLQAVLGFDGGTMIKMIEDRNIEIWKRKV